MDKYKPTIGLEVHAELSTTTKMFCNSRNNPDEEKPNVHVCPVCLGYPGTLPVINKEAVRKVLSLGVAVGGKMADYTEFDRKNYFYPDIPKGYQISQYKFPLISGGSINDIELTRVHLEEDTAKSTHHGDYSLVDFNRAGVPLMELVTEPVIHDAETAGNFARELQLILTYLDISKANMEKGEMRVEANVSVSASKEFGTKVEVKNLNSFKAVEKAIRFEVNRQVELLEKGESVVQETRGWDENKEVTFSQRAKEDSHDYRYFPDPDLPKLFIKDIFDEKELKKALPELPSEKRSRYKKHFGLKDEDVEIYIRDTSWGRYFEGVAGILKDKKLIQLASNYINSDLKSEVPTEDFAEVVKMVNENTISSRGAKDILKILQASGGKPRAIAEERGLMQKSDPKELESVVKQIIDENKKVVDEYKGGKEASLQFLIGQAMKATKGSANPQVLKEIFEKLI